MKIHLVSGGCSFIGRNMVKRLYQTTNDTILFIDNLLTGEHPSSWLDLEKVGDNQDIAIFGEDERLLFLQDNFSDWLAAMTENPQYLQEKYGLAITKFKDVFHFATLLEATSILANNPVTIIENIALDEAFFHWVTQHQPERVLYASTSEIYKQATSGTELKESIIDFKNIPSPTNTYRWSKLKGEYLAQAVAKNHDISTTCIRVFSPYGTDQSMAAAPIPAIAARVARQEDPLIITEIGQHGQDFIHINDVLDGIFIGMQQIKDGTALNIGSGKITAFIEIVHLLCTIADYDPLIKQSLGDHQNHNTTYANMDYGKTLGWQPKVPIEEGLIHTYLTALKRERAAEVV